MSEPDRLERMEQANEYNSQHISFILSKLDHIEQLVNEMITQQNRLIEQQQQDKTEICEIFSMLIGELRKWKT